MQLQHHAKIITAILLTVLLSACATDMKTAPDFRTAVRYHLDAVENRDLETFKTTLTKTDNLYVIFPGGGLLENTRAVVDFHEGWFKDNEWIFKTEIEKVIEGTKQSTALVKYNYQDSADTEPRQAWLVLTFELEDNSWRLIHDQNTRIDPEDDNMSEHEKLNYAEFPSTDIAASKTFFSQVFSWEFEDYGPEYTAFSNQGLNGGFFKAPKASLTKNGAALMIFYSKDLENTLEKIKQAGGTINQETFSYPGGRRFHFIEPGGSEFAVWSEELEKDSE